MSKSLYFVLAKTSLLLSQSFAQPMTIKTNDLNILQSSNTVSLVSYTELPNERFSRDTSQPQPRGSGAVWMSDNNLCYTVSYEYEEPPGYRSLGTPSYQAIDYNSDRALIYWRPVHIGAYFTPKGGLKISTHEMFIVEESGSVSRQGEYSYKHTFSPGEIDLYLNQLTMAMGIGFSQRLSTWETSHAKVDTMQVAAKANRNSRFSFKKPGEWHIVYDKKSGVVRAGHFVLEESGLDTTIVTTTGTLSNKSLAIAKEGNVRSSESSKGDTYRFLKIDSSPDYTKEFEKTKAMIDSKLLKAATQKRLESVN